MFEFPRCKLLINLLMHPKVVQERLGHKYISTTMDLYSHVMPNMQKEAVVKFETALEKGSEVQFSEILQ